MAIHLFGIRHHGAGSTKRLMRALEALQPDAILIEGVEEADSLLPYLKQADEFTLPVAQLIYNPKNFQQAVYYPFTTFSPEWNAMLYAIRNQIGLAHIDLPQSHRLALEDKAPATLQPTADETTETEADAYQHVVQDPIGFMARLAGYEDGERWWEVMFEQQTDNIALFDSLAMMLTELRAQFPLPAGSLDLLREAYMRQAIRKAQKAGYQKIAVVCGAYHVPALNLDAFKAKEDAALLKGLPKVKLQAAWIPWTYQRIATSSGYGAGLVSPAWYHFLYENEQNAAVQWLVNVAQLLRLEDIDSSSAHVIEAVRLAETLATLRGLALPTLDELNEAAITVLLNGDSEPFQLIQQQLIIGQRLGAVPKSVPTTPLQQDFESQVKKLKLTKYLVSNPAKGKDADLQLDLREAHDREQSQFLHRLSMLGIAWGRERGATGRELSTKNEYWNMDWQPHYTLSVIEASVWGSTLELAAMRYVAQTAQKTDSLHTLAQLLQQAIKSNLPQAFEQILQQLQDVAALSKDVEHLMMTLPNLVQIIRYGDVRQTDTTLVRTLVGELVPRVTILLPMACVSISDELAQKINQHILATHRALQLYNEANLLGIWYEMLHQIAQNTSTHAFIQGVCTRLLFDTQQLNVEATATLMQLALSQGSTRGQAASWLEGFLFSSGLLLIYNPDLWRILDSWVAQLQEDIFLELLPILRRTFSKFAKPEREKMLQLAQHGADAVAVSKRGNLPLDAERVAQVLPTLQLFLNM